MAGIRPIAPISYTDNTGRQYLIPSSAVTIDDASNKVTLANWHAPQSVDKTPIEAWLNYLAHNGEITRATPSGPPPAMVITAKDGGANGNTITVEISNVDPATAKFDATVTETDQYTGLTPETIETILGTSPHLGLRPGLVFVVRGDAPKAPKAQTNTALAGDPAKVDVSASSGTAFTLQAKGSGTDGALTTVSTVSTAQGFDLTVKWTKTMPGITAAGLAAQFDYVIDVKPLPGRPLGLPAAGTVTLAGGADAGPAARAAAVVPSAQ